MTIKKTLFYGFTPYVDVGVVGPFVEHYSLTKLRPYLTFYLIKYAFKMFMRVFIKNHYHTPIDKNIIKLNGFKVNV